MEGYMSRFELPKDARDLDPILNDYRPKKWSGNHTEADRGYGDFANHVDEEPIGYPAGGNDTERSRADRFHHESSSPSTGNLRGNNGELGYSRLNEIAEAIRTLTYGEMLELAESMWKVNAQGSEMTESDLPKVLYRWSKSRSIKN
jgi:hypothetical protein